MIFSARTLIVGLLLFTALAVGMTSAATLFHSRLNSGARAACAGVIDATTTELADLGVQNTALANALAATPPIQTQATVTIYAQAPSSHATAAPVSVSTTGGSSAVALNAVVGGVGCASTVPMHDINLPAGTMVTPGP